MSGPARQAEFGFAVPAEWITLEEARDLAKDRAGHIDRWRRVGLVRSHFEARRVIVHRGDLVVQLNIRPKRKE